jgi:dolichol-phosphate mannosyltransferase
MFLSVIMPAHNEEGILAETVGKLLAKLGEEEIPYELIIVDDNSTDQTLEVANSLRCQWPAIRIVRRTPPAGFGRAVRSGLEVVTGDVVIIVMADDSDDPKDIVAYYKKIQEGYDCVFGSRFRRGSVVKDYPKFKLLLNRIVNKMIQILFWTRYNDITNDRDVAERARAQVPHCRNSDHLVRPYMGFFQSPRHRDGSPLFERPLEALLR